MYKVTLIPGDGIGPEVAFAAKEVIDATGVNIDWEVEDAGAKVFEEKGELVPQSVYDSLEANKVCLKGPITTPIGSGFRSINVALRKKYDLYTNMRPVKKIEGTNSPFEEIDLVIFRENTEGLYIGIEEEVEDGKVEAKKVITKKGSERIIRKSFEYAKSKGIDVVTVAHKANILKLADGLFLSTAREIATEYDIELNEVIIDNMCMQLVMYPEKYKVVVTMNLYGDILSDLCAGLIGGLGLVPGANIGDDMAIFEAVHGSAPDIAGMNKANPTALLLSGAMMLDHLGETKAADKVRNAIEKVIGEGKTVTADLGGTASTDDYKNALIECIKAI